MADSAWALRYPSWSGSLIGRLAARQEVGQLQPYPRPETASTEWRWKRVRVKAAPARGQREAPIAVPAESQSTLKDRYKPFTLTLSYKGGAESSWLVSYGNRLWRVPGWMALEDVVRVFERTLHVGER